MPDAVAWAMAMKEAGQQKGAKHDKHTKEWEINVARSLVSAGQPPLSSSSLLSPYFLQQLSQSPLLSSGDFGAPTAVPVDVEFRSASELRDGC